jgi:hypothetical protein
MVYSLYIYSLVFFMEEGELLTDPTEVIDVPASEEIVPVEVAAEIVAEEAVEVSE